VRAGTAAPCAHCSTALASQPRSGRQVDISGCSAVGTDALQELRRFRLRVLRLARIWHFEVRPSTLCWLACSITPACTRCKRRLQVARALRSRQSRNTLNACRQSWLRGGHTVFNTAPHPCTTVALDCTQDLQLVHDISQRGRLEVLDLSQTAVRVGEPLCRALLLSVAGLTVLSTTAGPRQRVAAVGASATAGGRLPLRELSLGGNTCASLICSDAAVCRLSGQTMRWRPDASQQMRTQQYNRAFAAPPAGCEGPHAALSMQSTNPAIH